MNQIPVGGPLELVALDICGPFVETKHGNVYILVLSDYFTKWTEAYPIPNHTAFTVADCVVTQFIARFGVPQVIHTDQGSEFESQLMHALCNLLDIQKTKTSPYQSQSDGLVERINCTIKRMLKCVVNEAKDDWDNHLPYVMMAYRASVQESTKCTPNLLMLGRETNWPVDLMFQKHNPLSEQCPIRYIEWVKAATQQAFEFVRDKLGRAAQHQKKLYDRRKKTPKFEVGDWVWRIVPARQKIDMKWHGPYLVLSSVGEVGYKIQ